MTNPPVSPDPDRPYTLDQMMPAPRAIPPSERVLIGPPAAPPRKPHWWRDLGSGGQAVIIIAAVLAPLLIGVLIFAKLSAGAPDTIKFDLVSCSYSGDTLPAATAEFTATNSGDRDYRMTIKWEFRDSSGRRIDTDTTRVMVPAGETIRDSETTLLPVAASGGTCGYSLS